MRTLLYKINGLLRNTDVILSFKALKMIEDVSCIRFQQQREVQHKDYIEFLAGRGCYSQVGRSGYGKQEIFLRRECAQVGTHLIVHEVSQQLYRRYNIDIGDERWKRMQHL